MDLPVALQASPSEPARLNGILIELTPRLDHYSERNIQSDNSMDPLTQEEGPVEADEGLHKRLASQPMLPFKAYPAKAQ